ncbi:MAG: aldehyde dehydrogenase family protein [Planctomycetes bacterium]|nr:aldehyde dehydrogenase family protein [Planctomycetota bacterium]
MDPSFLSELGIRGESSGAYCGHWLRTAGERLAVVSPIDGREVGAVRRAGAADYDTVARAAHEAFLRWREVPAPRRGELVRQIGLELRAHKEALGRLVTLETGKILEEGRGEIQEAIDIADFATGLSRQLYGLTLKSERPRHAMRETWHPLGVAGVITAFNFPAAVWAWNSMLALVCGDACVWKPSQKTPLTAIAMTRVCAAVLEREGFGGLLGLVIGSDDEVGARLLDDPRLPLVSATGSTRMGRIVAQRVGARLGRTLLELGGNNAVVVLDDADLAMAARAILFGAVGTAGQRCTTTRRLIATPKALSELERRLVEAYRQVRIGDPFDPATLMGPLIDGTAVRAMQQALAHAREQGGRVVHGGGTRALLGALAGGHYVEPALVRAEPGMPVVREETFAPILYLLEAKDLDHAIAIHNDVPQGLSSAIFTLNARSAERFLSETGSDCGIANVNIGTSGAEIGGAFGGEKETGGGRESGSDAWKAYMRRQTSTVNYGLELPLAQGIKFGDL